MSKLGSPVSSNPSFGKLSAAQKFLQTAETSATHHPSSSDFTTTPPGFYKPHQKSQTHFSFKQKLSRHKKSLPAFVLSIILLGFFIFLSFTANLGFRLEEAIVQATDHQYTFNRLISRRVTGRILNGDHQLSDRFATRLKKQKISIGTLDDSGNFVEDLEFNNKKPRVFQFDGEIIDSKNLNLNYNSNPKFRNAYVSARHGRVMGFFDNPALFLYRKIGQSRNVFANYRQTGDSAADQKSYRQTLSDRFSNHTNAEFNTTKEQTRTEPDGKTTTEQVPNGDNVNTANLAGDTPNAKARAFLSGVSDKINAANIGCALLQVGNIVSVAVAANNIYNNMNYFMNNIENSSKTKAGEGNHAALNPFLNFLSTTTTSTITDSGTNQEISVTGSPLESEGLRSALDPNYAPKQTVTQNYSLESTMSSVLLALTTNGISTAGCRYLRGSGAALSLALLTVPGGGFIKMISGFLMKTATSTALQLGAGTILAFLIPTIAKSLFTNLPDNISGLPAGEALMSGAAASNEALGRSSSGLMPASRERALSFNQATTLALQQDAEVTRLFKHPFDSSSSQTFLGALINKLAPISSFTSIFSFSTLNNLISKSLAAFSPLSFANGENTSFATSFGHCERLNSIGADGDVYCNPHSVADTSITEIDPDDPTYLSVINPNLTTDSDGNQTVKEHSELANFIMYCAERNSPFGVYDANIANSLEFSLGTVGDNLPVIEDIVDIANSIKSSSTEAWATGANCVNSAQNPRWDNEMKYYQLYIEYNRIFDQNGDFEHSTNPIISFKDHYYQQHPLDQSDSGYLARISGLSKDDAATVLAIFDTLKKYHDYHPEYRLQFASKTTDILALNFFSNLPIKPLPLFASSSFIVYNNLRNRTIVI